MKDNPKKYYSFLDSNGRLIAEHVIGYDGDEKVDYFGFEDALNESEDEGTELEDYGDAYYFHDDKVIRVNVFLPDYEGTGISELNKDEVNELVDFMLSMREGEEEFFMEEHADWISNFLDNYTDEDMMG